MRSVVIVQWRDKRSPWQKRRGLCFSHKEQEMQKGEWLIFVSSHKVQEKQESWDDVV